MLCDIPYRDPQLGGFIEDFYGGRVPLAQFGAEHYLVARCRRCGMIYQPRILDREGMRCLYEDWVDQAASLRKKENAPARLFRKYAGQLQTLSRLLPGPPQRLRILDYGMGWGYWCRMAQAHGYDVTGLELSAARRAHARELGIRVEDSLPSAARAFDFIQASQVFEHLPAPLESLQELAARLSTGGVLYLRVPDGRRVEAVLRRLGWSPGLDAIHPLEHINCFTRKTLVELAARAGLEPVAPPVRLGWGNLCNGIKRELADRYLNTHVYFRRATGNANYSALSK